MKQNDNRVLGRILAVEETQDVSGGWTLGSAGDTAKSTDTGTRLVDSSNTIIDLIISPSGSGR
jgi:hypothetical protein